MKEIYFSWLKRTEKIVDDCNYCNNQRYYIIQDSITVNTIYACPVCNFDDLQITKKSSLIPLHLFPLIKANEININILK